MYTLLTGLQTWTFGVTVCCRVWETFGKFQYRPI